MAAGGGGRVSGRAAGGSGRELPLEKLSAARGEAPAGRVVLRAMRIGRSRLFSLSWTNGPESVGL